MLKLISGVLTALALIFAPSMAKANELSCMPLKVFIEEVGDYMIQDYVLTPDIDAKLTKEFAEWIGFTLNPKMKYNTAISVLKGGNAGLVLLQNGCVLTGTAKSMSSTLWLQLLREAGITEWRWTPA